MLSSKLPPKKPPRMNITKAANKFDDAQLKMSSTIASCINTSTTTTSNANNNNNISDENHIKITKRNYTTTTVKPMPLTGQLSADKAVMTKKKHLHFHSPLIKSPLKNATEQQQLKNNEQELPRLLFAGIESNKAARINLALTTTATSCCTRLTKGTVATSNIATILHSQQHNYHVHSHQHHQNHYHNNDDKNNGAMSKAMNFKVSGNMTARRRRLDRGCSSLMYACQHGDIKEVLDQLHNKPQVIYKRDSKNKNALHYCSATATNEGVAFRDQQTRTNSLVAAASIAIAAPELLESADEDGFTPLHLAVIQGNLAMVNLLLSNKADVNVVDNEGHSVVHWATVCGEIEALRAVLAAGAAVTTPDINGGSPLHYAAQMCGASYESKVNVPNSTQLALEILDILLKHPQSSVDVQDKDGRQPLLWAASAGSAKAVIALVKAGARVESSDKDGLTALHCAASRGHTECIDTLISLCGAPTDLIDANGCTALHYAVTLGHADATARLMDLDADPNRQDRKGRTPAHCGCAKGQFETVRLLKERGANLWLRNAKGDLPVHEAASSGRRELVEWLLEQRPKQVNTTSNDGRSLLHIAAVNDYTDMCKMLLDHGSEINALFRNSKGVVMTPLDCALQKGYRSTAKFLQSQRGLPAGKLRFAPRPANPFDGIPTDFVRPLRYSEREDMQDLHESKKYVVYHKHSDSEGNGYCSCTERTYKREQRYAHTCRRHERSRKKKLRRRTSSCGESKEICQHEDGSDICRSKSNIEIRRRRSREQYVPSSGSEHCDEDVDSCENCCYHKHQKHKIFHRKRLYSRNSKDYKDAENGDVKEEVGGKSNLNSMDKLLKEDQNNKSLSVVTKQSKEIDIPVENENATSKAAGETTGRVLDLTDEEEHVPETLTTTVDVHREADDSNSKTIENAEESLTPHKEYEEIDIEEKIENSVDRVFEIATQEILEQQQHNEEKLQNSTDGKETLDAANNDELNDVKETLEEKNVENITIEETPATPIDTSPHVTENEQEQNGSISKPATPIDTAVTTPSAQSPTPTETTEKNSKTAKESDSGERVEAEEKRTSLTTTQALESQIPQREQETRRSFTLLPSDSAEEQEPVTAERKTSFQILKSDESAGEVNYRQKNEHEEHELSDNQVFKIMPEVRSFKQTNMELSSAEGEAHKTDYVEVDHEESELDGAQRFKPLYGRHSLPEPLSATGAMTVYYDNSGGRKRRLKRRVKSAGKSRNAWKNIQEVRENTNFPNKDQQDSGFEPSPRAGKSKIPTPRNIYTAYAPRRPNYTTMEGRALVSRIEGRKPGDKFACDMSAVTRSIQRNIRRYYMERKIFQHLLDLKSLQIRSNKLNEAVLVKRAVDDYHKSCAVLGGETGTRLRRYTYSEYTFKNFELFLYETLKSLQKPGTYNFQNINEVYEEAERRLSPDYNAYEKALQCTSKTHRCLHAAHAYTGIPCAAYIPMMNHHTMPKFGFGNYKKTGVGSFYLPKILTKTGGSCDGVPSCSGAGKVALELSSGKSKQMISLPAEKFDSNKRYYVTFTVKESGNNIPTRNCYSAAVPQMHDTTPLPQHTQTSTK